MNIIKKICKNEILCKLIEVFFITWSLIKISKFSVANIFGLVFLFFSFMLIKISDEYNKIDKNQKMGICVLSGIYTLMYSLTDYYSWVYMLENKLFKLIIVIAVFMGLYLLFKRILLTLTGVIDKWKVNKTDIDKENIRPNVFISVTILCMLAYFPYFLYLYPGVMTPDSVNQLEQALGMIPYSNHHPWAHTLFIKLCFNIGYKITGDRNVGVAVYTIAQMLIVSMSAGYIIDTLKKLKVNRVILILSALFFAFVPYNAVFAVTMWKDIIFSYFVLNMMCALIRIITLNDTSKFTYALFAVSSLIMCLFRTNGFPAFLVTAVLLIVYFRKKLFPMLPIIIVITLLSLIFKGPVMKAYNVKQPDFTESIAVPAQMLSRVLVNDRELSADDMYEIKHVVDLTYIKELYVPDYGDNIKELIRAGHPEYLESHKGQFLKMFIRIGLKYPADYLHAYVDLTNGYWYPDNDIIIAETEGIPDNSCGVFSYPLLRGKVVVKLKEIFLKLGTMIPVYGTLWCLGAGFWFTLYTLVYILTHDNKKEYIIVIPILALMGTLFIASPISGVFRYAYFMMLSIPLYVGLILKSDN